MIHLGDICKISGRDAPTVNVIIGGSPCQDLSVAGKRAGLSGERSGLFVLSRLNEYCEEKTMASLFDGIGGFPLIWEFLNGTGSAVWCSEIEEFPIAVTKIRFPDNSERGVMK